MKKKIRDMPAYYFTCSTQIHLKFNDTIDFQKHVMRSIAGLIKMRLIRLEAELFTGIFVYLFIIVLFRRFYFVLK